MRKVVLVLVLLLVSVPFFSGCGDDDSPEYYVKFKLDGVQKNFIGSFTDLPFDSRPAGSYSTGDSATLVFGCETSSSVNGGSIYNFLMLVFTGNGTGVFSGANAMLYYRGDGSMLDPIEATINVDVYEGVGGVVGGTFSGSVSNDISGLMQITAGSFRCMVMTNNAIEF